MNFRSQVFAAAALACFGASAAMAQDPPEPPAQSATDQAERAAPPTDSQALDQSPPAAADAAAFDDQKLEQFANAYAEVQTIQQKAAEDLETTTAPAEADEVKSIAQTDMIAAVERSGLQVEEFNQIVQSMASNMEVRNRVAEKLQKRTGG